MRKLSQNLANTYPKKTVKAPRKKKCIESIRKYLQEQENSSIYDDRKRTRKISETPVELTENPLFTG